MNTIEELRKFVAIAVKNRKYSLSQQAKFNGAIKFIETDLNEQELGSMDELTKNLTSIVDNILTKNSDKFTISTIDTYKKRFSKVIKDYKIYNKDVSKMENWSSSKKSKSSDPAKRTTTKVIKESDNEININESVLNKVEIVLSNGNKAIIITPYDMNEGDGLRLKAYIDYLIATIPIINENKV